MLIIIGIMLVLSLFIVAFLKPEEQRIQISYAEAQNDKEKVKLVKPSLFGIDNKNQHFKLTASSGVQLYNEEYAYFYDVIGKMELFQAEDVLSIAAKQCDVDLNKKQLRLTKEVILELGVNKYNAFTDVLCVSLRNGNMWGDKEIIVRSKTGEIKANSFNFNSQSRVLNFEGNVVAIIENDG